MSQIKNLRGQCQHCGGLIEFHAESAGATADCPHCNQSTELLLETPVIEDSPVGTKMITFIVIVVLILTAGIIGASVALKRAKRMRAEQEQLADKSILPKAPADPFGQNGFRVSPVTLDIGNGSALIYAVGNIVNTSPRQRFGVKVELELFDELGAKVGVASDYQKVIEPGAEWRFRALVVDKKVATAKIFTVTESK